MINDNIAKLLAVVNHMVGVENPAKQMTNMLNAENAIKVRNKNRKVGYGPTHLKRGSAKYIKSKNEQKRIAERKEKKHRKMEARSRRINRLRGVGI